MEGVKILFASTAFARLSYVYFSLLLLFASNRGTTLVQQGPPQRLNYWQWHLIYLEGGQEWIYFRSSCLYEESPWTLQMLGIQIRGDIWVLYFFREKSRGLSFLPFSFTILNRLMAINQFDVCRLNQHHKSHPKLPYHLRRDTLTSIPHSL